MAAGLVEHAVRALARSHSLDPRTPAHTALSYFTQEIGQSRDANFVKFCPTNVELTREL